MDACNRVIEDQANQETGLEKHIQFSWASPDLHRSEAAAAIDLAAMT
jgi:hypothetical protein